MDPGILTMDPELSGIENASLQQIINVSLTFILFSSLQFCFTLSSSPKIKSIHY